MSVLFLIFVLLALASLVILFLSAAYFWRSIKGRQRGIPFRLLRLLFAGCSACCALGFLLWVGSIHLFWSSWARTGRENADREQRVLLYRTDHRAILKAGRDVLSDTNLFPSQYPSIEKLPEAIRELRPSYVFIYPNREILSIEKGGGFFHFGFSIYADGVSGSGTKELLPGLWYYAEDDKILQEQ